jgi:hypothetical protein
MRCDGYLFETIEGGNSWNPAIIDERTENELRDSKPAERIKNIFTVQRTTTVIRSKECFG